MKTKLSMRNLLCLILVFSCKGKIDESGLGYFSNREFSLDTVLIDPGDEIIFLKYQLLNADVGKGGKYLYNFNESDFTVEKINLDELRLEEKVPFEKEGPNGLGPGVGNIRVYNESQITMNGLFQTSLFSLDGEKLMTVYFENFSLGGHPLEGGSQLRPSRVLDVDAKRLYGLIHRNMDKKTVLGILYLDDFKISRIEVGTFERLPNYTFVNSTGNAVITLLPEMEIEKFGTKVVLSNQVISSLMWYDTDKDSLFIKSYSSQLTANQKTDDYKLEHVTDESFDVEYTRYKREINFMSPFWDLDRQCFYRFSYEENTTGSEKAKVYLTVFDEELNQIGETLVPKLTKKPGRHFAKDGKIWIFENIDDELAFIRLAISK